MVINNNKLFNYLVNQIILAVYLAIATSFIDTYMIYP